MPIIPGYMGYSTVPNTLVHEKGPTETGINLANRVYDLDIWYPLEARSYLPNESGNTSPRPWSIRGLQAAHALKMIVLR